MALLQQRIVDFHRDGFLVLPEWLPPETVRRLLHGLKREFSEPIDTEEAKLRGELVARLWRPRLFERGVEFEELVDFPATIELMEAILGPQCHLIAMNALKTGPGDGISGWHADEEVRFPWPADLPRDPRVATPSLVINMNYYLVDVDENLGPTQLVPGSHRAGRQPTATDMDGQGNPTFEGRSMHSATGKAGTAVMWHDQVWHRGATKRLERRYPLGSAGGIREALDLATVLPLYRLRPAARGSPACQPHAPATAGASPP